MYVPGEWAIGSMTKFYIRDLDCQLLAYEQLLSLGDLFVSFRFASKGLGKKQGPSISKE